MTMRSAAVQRIYSRAVWPLWNVARRFILALFMEGAEAEDEKDDEGKSRGDDGWEPGGVGRDHTGDGEAVEAEEHRQRAEDAFEDGLATGSDAGGDGEEGDDEAGEGGEDFGPGVVLIFAARFGGEVLMCAEVAEAVADGVVGPVAILHKEVRGFFVEVREDAQGESIEVRGRGSDFFAAGVAMLDFGVGEPPLAIEVVCGIGGDGHEARGAAWAVDCDAHAGEVLGVWVEEFIDGPGTKFFCVAVDDVIGLFHFGEVEFLSAELASPLSAARDVGIVDPIDKGGHEGGGEEDGAGDCEEADAVGAHGDDFGMAAKTPHCVECGEHECGGGEPLKVGCEVGAEVFGHHWEWELGFHQAREGPEEFKEDIDGDETAQAICERNQVLTEYISC